MVTWPSREQKPTCTDVLLILVFVWSVAICLFPQRQAGRWLGKEEEDLEFGKAGLRTLKCCSVRPSICFCRVASLCQWILCVKINQTESRKKRHIAQKQICRTLYFQARKKRKTLSGPVWVYVRVPLHPGHLEGQRRCCCICSC
uniref:Uncharacterized protein n=1 Tax=Molossus molossus TaxID=27622 RepID=A0A7J8J8A8_MOLMO|nr:hypothetical protein HJG59_009587 [Molossus molossus]